MKKLIDLEAKRRREEIELEARRLRDIQKSRQMAGRFAMMSSFFRGDH